MKPHALDPTHARGREASFVLEPAVCVDQEPTGSIPRETLRFKGLY
jgi:hypothetical protein